MMITIWKQIEMKEQEEPAKTIATWKKIELEGTCKN